MDVKERVTSCRLVTKIVRDPGFAKKLGIKSIGIIYGKEEVKNDVQSRTEKRSI